MFKEIICSRKYWASTMLLGVGFVLLYSAIEHLSEFVRLPFNQFIANNFSEGRWIRYLISRLVGGLSYGMIMAYFFEKRKHKSK